MTAVIEDYTTAAALTSASDISIAYPAGIVAGEKLLVVVINEAKSNANTQWDDSTLKPAGFDFINESGDITCDCHVGAFEKIAAGTETGNFTIPSQISTTEDTCAWCYRLSSAGDVNVIGADTNSALNVTSLAIAGVNTTVDDCLVFAVHAYDGGDGPTFTTSGTGWTKHSEVTSDGADTLNGSSGCVSTKVQATLGATDDCTISSGTSDGMTGFMFAIEPGESNGVGVLTIPALTLSAQGTNEVAENWGVGTLVIPALTLTAAGTNPSTGVGVLAIPNLTLSGVGVNIPVWEIQQIADGAWSEEAISTEVWTEQ